jgi:hypothetical protein
VNYTLGSCCVEASEFIEHDLTRPSVYHDFWRRTSYPAGNPYSYITTLFTTTPSALFLRLVVALATAYAHVHSYSYVYNYYLQDKLL